MSSQIFSILCFNFEEYILIKTEYPLMEGLQANKSKSRNYSETRYFGQLNGLELLRGAFTTNFFKPHFHETYSIILINNGVGDYSYKQKEYIVPQGELLLLNPYDIHTGRSIGKDVWRFQSIYIPTSYVKETLNWDKPQNLDAGIVKDPIFTRKAFQLHQALMEKNDLLEIESLLSNFLHELFSTYSTSAQTAIKKPEEGNRIRAIRDYLHDNYNQEIALDELSAQFNISRFHLIKSFCRQYGLPPHKYLINLRIEKSKPLLRKQWPVTRVAYETGFYDQSHFINSFKKLVGTTPKKYALSV